MESKLCPDCGEPRPVSEFAKNRSRPGGLQAYCKVHSSQRFKQRRQKPDYAMKQREFFMRWKYGITPGEFDELMARQDGKCAICKANHTEVKRPGMTKRGLKPHGLVVDHSHETDVVRGLLCDRCNRALGLFHDDLIILQAAVGYLKTNGLNYTPVLRRTARSPRSGLSALGVSDAAKSL